MTFLIADTFTDSLARLSGDEQKAVKTSAFDLQMDPSNPGMQFHKLDHARDKRFWSVRVSGDLRIIVHKTSDSLLLCYVDHHDAAYRWAERRRLETHPKTGAAQMVELRETVQEVVVPKYVEEVRSAPPKRPVLTGISDEELLAYGVPAEWLSAAREATEDSLLELAAHLPGEAAEALLDLAVGKKPQAPVLVPSHADPFAHPDAQRRFRVMTTAAELERALDYPWDKWTVFLHPAQRELVERDYNGPARVSGSAGTGKTIVALHRAVHLARANQESRVLLTTFSETLAAALRGKLRRLISNEPRLAERLEVAGLDAVGIRLYNANIGRANLAPRESVRSLIEAAASATIGHNFSALFLHSEWDMVVDAWQLKSWEDYRDVARLGRKSRLAEKQRVVLWSIFEKVLGGLAEQKLITLAGLFTLLSEHVAKCANPPFEYVVVDESQDVSVSQLRFLAALGGGRPNGSFFAGDLGQRIFQQAFSWKSVGVDIRGRSRTLKINYRTSQQIRSQADRLLAPEITDVDGNAEDRRGTISVLQGPSPTVWIYPTAESEGEGVAEWLDARIAEGVLPHEIGIFVRSESQIIDAEIVAKNLRLPYRVLGENMDPAHGCAMIGTMHTAKGLEFRAVAVMKCDDQVLPSQERIAAVTDESELEDVYNSERHLLYVACTRARDYLLVTATEPASEFLDDLTLD